MTANHLSRLLKIPFFGVSGFLLLFIASPVFGQSTAFSFQGELMENGQPAGGPAGANFDLFFTPYDAQFGGNPLTLNPAMWSGIVKNGRFTATLDFGAETGQVLSAPEVWFEIIVNGALLFPRQRLAPAPLALQLVLPSSSTVNAAGCAYEVKNSNDAGTAICGRVIGNSPTQASFGVRGESDSVRGIGAYGVARHASVGAITYGVIGQVRPDGLNCGVLGWNTTQLALPGSTPPTGDGAGVYGLAPALGVKGVANAASGTTYGGYFSSASPVGRAVFGIATATTGDAEGVKGESASNSGSGVVGLATASTGLTYGGWFSSASTGGRAVFGTATAATGDAEGVKGQSASNSGSGVVGVATATSGITYGGFFQSDSSTGRGLIGYASAASGTSYGVVGQAASPGGYGVFSSGNCHVAGNLSVSGIKAFQIDHPLDPENKVLNHYCAEGPQPFNMYRGRVTLDGQGRSWVELPDYFGEINKDVEYHLTCIGGHAQVYVADEISGNRFRIGGGTPGLKVSWMVTAIRDDRWVKTHGAPVEVEKSEENRGTYLQPELYGQPKEKGQFHRAEAGAAGVDARDVERQ